MFNRQYRTPLFKALEINVDAIAEEFDYLTHEQAEETAELFAAYLTDPDAWDFLRDFAISVYEREQPSF